MSNHPAFINSHEPSFHSTWPARYPDPAFWI